MNARRHSSAGVTLLEMMVVAALIGLMVGISFPAISAGVDSLRLNQASTELVSFFNDALNRAERHGQVVAITIARGRNSLEMRSTEPGFEKRLELPQGISIVRILPELDQPGDMPRQFLFYPGGAVPSAGVEFINQRNVRRTVRVDPIAGVPKVERAGPQ